MRPRASIKLTNDKGPRYNNAGLLICNRFLVALVALTGGKTAAL